MNTLVYADTSEDEASSASSIASTMQQLSISFGVALAGLTSAMFIPRTNLTSGQQVVHAIHDAFLLLALLTVVSGLVFTGLKAGDGGDVSQQRPPHHGG